MLLFNVFPCFTSNYKANVAARDAAALKYHGEFAWLNFPVEVASTPN